MWIVGGVKCHFDRDAKLTFGEMFNLQNITYVQMFSHILYVLSLRDYEGGAFVSEGESHKELAHL